MLLIFFGFVIACLAGVLYCCVRCAAKADEKLKEMQNRKDEK